MSTLSINGKKAFYDVQGTGEPILILNGIMMSTKSWDPFMASLSANNRVIRLDFFDQGQSERLAGESYTLDIQVDLIEELLDHLGLDAINIVGISYGGEVALLYATKHPDRVRRLVLFNTSAYTSPWLKEIGWQWNAIGRMRDGKAYYRATIPVIYSPSFYENNLDWMKKREEYLVPLFSNPEFLDQMERLTNSAESFDVRDDLDRIASPTLLIAADEDYLTPIANQKYLKARIPRAELVILPGVGHASMYERPLLFVTMIIGFVNATDDTYSI
ncbi:MAG: alpha/beta fold hydrolase [Acholeplasmataceae bacterium]